MKIQGAIFDMDGTLVDTLMLWDVMWEHFGRLYRGIEGFRPDPLFEKELRTMVLRDAMEYIHAHCGIGRNAQELVDHFDEILPELYADKFLMKPGAKEFLDYCLEQNIPMVLASATAKKFIEIALDSRGIRKYFGAVLSCSDIGKGKDHPDIFLEALRILGTDIEETCVFEDSYVALETASAAGFKTVGVYDKYAFEQERLKNSADYYIAKGETLMKLTPFEK